MAKNMYQKREERKNKPVEEKTSATNINWYPGHMAKTRRLIQEKLSLVDIIFEVIDARIPASSKIKDIDDLIKNKPRLLVMTKYDLCDKEETNKWIKHYESLGYVVIPCDLIKENIKNKTVQLTKKILTELNEKRQAKGMRIRAARVMVIGIPNVGKSTLINQLVGRKAVNVGNKPGVTKSLDWIRINDDLELMDTPGILWPRLDNQEIANNLATFTAIKEEVIPVENVSFYILSKLKEYYPEVLHNKYKVDNISIDDMEELYDCIGRSKGILVKGGEVDFERVSISIINDIKNGVIKSITFDRMVEDELFN